MNGFINDQEYRERTTRLINEVIPLIEQELLSIKQDGAQQKEEDKRRKEKSSSRR
jgi:hypothetical protein